MSTTRQDLPAGPDFGMTDLEEALRGPDGPAIREDAITRLDDMSRRVEAELTSGAPPGRYDRLKAVQIAISTASRIVAVNPSTIPSQGAP